jgi:hypothetical protein
MVPRKCSTSLGKCGRVSTTRCVRREQGMKTHHALSLAAVAVSVLACGGVTSSTSARLDGRGGTVALQSGLTVELPSGAVSHEVEVTVRETRHGDEVQIEVEPRGLHLEHPADVSWSDDGREAESESGERLEQERHGDGRVHHAMGDLGSMWLRHGHDDARDGGDDRGHDADAGDDHAQHDGGDDQGHHDGGDDLGQPDAGDNHGGDADGGVADAGDDHGGHGGGHP